MAYPDTKTYLSKVQLGDVTYYIKDAEAKSVIDQLKAAAYKDVATSVDASDQGLVTGAQVAAAIHDIAGALHLIAVLDDSAETFADALAAYKTAHPEYVEADGDIMLWKKMEYLYADEEWRELGSEGQYVLKTTTIAGIDLQDNITVAELQTALGLGALAYKDSATGTVSGQTITGVHATGKSVGTISVVLDQNNAAASLTKTDYTPEGNVEGTTTAAGLVSLAASESDDAFQVSGTVSAPTITVTPATASIQTIDSVGTQATFTEGAFHQGSLPNYVQGSKAEWTATVDNETLSFSFTPNGTDTWDAGELATKDADTFEANVLPTKSAAMTVATGITSATATAPVFTGGKVAASFSGQSSDITATFSGTKAENALVTGVTYDKASVNAEGTKFTGGDTDLTVGTITVAAKDVTVS